MKGTQDTKFKKGTKIKQEKEKKKKKIKRTEPPPWRTTPRDVPLQEGPDVYPKEASKGRILTNSSSLRDALGTADVSPAFLFVAAIVWGGGERGQGRGRENKKYVSKGFRHWLLIIKCV